MMKRIYPNEGKTNESRQTSGFATMYVATENKLKPCFYLRQGLPNCLQDHVRGAADQPQHGQADCPRVRPPSRSRP